MTTCSPPGSTPGSTTGGPYDRLEEHWRALLAGAEGAGRKIAGAPLELYRVDAHDTNREEEYVTELQVRVERG